MRFSSTVVLALLFACYQVTNAVVGHGRPADNANKPTHRLDRVLVQYKVSETHPANKPRYATRPVSPGETVEQAIERLKKNPVFEAVEPDYYFYKQAIPSDYSASANWDMAKISAPAAWNVPANYEAVVCVIDSGIDHTHPELASQMHPTYLGYNAITQVEGRTGDDDGHGTHCAGTIGGAANTVLNGGDVNKNIVGVNWAGVKLIPCKFIGADGSGTTDDALRCVTYCGPISPISSNSWGGGSYSLILETEMKRVGDVYDHQMVFAAGNGGLFGLYPYDLDNTKVWPVSSDLPNMIGVAATDINDVRPTWSNHAESGPVEIAAPGVDILSSVPGGGYALNSGTSMSCPHVGGALAFMRSVTGPAVSMSRLRQLLVTNTDYVAMPSGTSGSWTSTDRPGFFRRLNVNLAVQAALAEASGSPSPSPPPRPPPSPPPSPPPPRPPPPPPPPPRPPPASRPPPPSPPPPRPPPSLRPPPPTCSSVTNSPCTSNNQCCSPLRCKSGVCK